MENNIHARTKERMIIIKIIGTRELTNAYYISTYY